MTCSAYWRSAEAGRAFVVAEEVQAEGQFPVQREPHHVGEARSVPVGDRDRQVRRMAGLTSCADRRLDEVKGRPAVDDRPLRCRAARPRRPGRSSPGCLRPSASRPAAGQPDTVAEQGGVELQPVLCGQLPGQPVRLTMSRWLRLASPPAYFSLTAGNPCATAERDDRLDRGPPGGLVHCLGGLVHVAVRAAQVAGVGHVQPGGQDAAARECQAARDARSGWTSDSWRSRRESRRDVVARLAGAVMTSRTVAGSRNGGRCGTASSLTTTGLPSPTGLKSSMCSGSSRISTTSGAQVHARSSASAAAGEVGAPGR